MIPCADYSHSVTYQSTKARWFGTDGHYYTATRTSDTDLWNVNNDVREVSDDGHPELETVGVIHDDQLRALIFDRRPGARAHAENANDRFEQRRAAIVRSIRSMADKVEQIEVATGQRYGVPPHASAVEQILHEVVWGMANLNLDVLVSIAGEADLASAL